MKALLKKDFLLNDWKVYSGMALFVLVMYMTTVSPVFIFVLAFFSLAFSLFSHDDKVNVNRFLVSVPVDRKWIVWSRYAYSLCAVMMTLLFQFIFMNALSPILNDSFYIYHARDLLALFCFGALIVAMCLPIIYFFSSLVTGMSIIIVLFGVGTFLLIGQLVTVLPGATINFNELDGGFALLVEKYFPWQPYLLLLIVTGIVVYLSVIVSVHFFKTKEI